MKKFFILFAAVVLTAMSANVFAQGTGTAPEIGSTHQYWVNGTYGNPTTGAELSTYTWWISSTPADLLTPTTLTTHFTVTGGATYNTPEVGETGIQLVWNPASAGSTYYLVIKENDGTCDNIKAVAIQPVNAFDVIFAALNESDVDVDNPSRCAPAIALTASGTTITYNYGSDEYIYKITSEGLYSDWTFNYAFTNTFGDANPTVEYSTDGTTYSSTNVTDSKTVDPDANGQKTVYFKVTLNNGTTAGTFEEGLAGQSMVLTLTALSDGTNAPANIYMSDGTTEFTGDIKQTQTVNARPATTTIGFN